MPPRKSPPPPADGASPDDAELHGLKLVMQEALGELLPLFEKSILDQVEAKIATAASRLPDQTTIVNQVAASIVPQLTAQMNEAVMRLQDQVARGLANANPSPPAQASSTAPAPPGQATAVDKIVGGTERIMVLLNTFVDSAGPKILDMMWKYQAGKSPWLHDLTAITMLKQSDPLRAAIIGQQLVGPNPYEMTLPNAMLSGAMWGMRIREAAKGATWQPGPTTPSAPGPSASSFVAPSLAPRPPSAPTQPTSSVSMSGGKSVLRLRPVAKTSPATAKPKTLADVLG